MIHIKKAPKVRKAPKARKEPKAKKSAHTTAKRTKVSIGKKQRVTRAASMAENKTLRADAAAEERTAYKQIHPESHIQKAIPPSFLLEEKKTQLISSLDLPRSKAKLQDALLTKVADSGVPFTPVEVGQMLSLSAVNGCQNYQAGSKLVQDLITRDYLPYKSALRALGRLYEQAFHFKGAKTVMEQLNNLYPQQAFDEVGMPIPKAVLTTAIPDFNELAQTPTSPTDLKAMKDYMDEVTTKHNGIAYRYNTQLQYMRTLIKQKKPKDAAAELFKIFNRIGLAETEQIPGAFEAVKFHAFMKKHGSGSEFKPDFPLFYNVVDSLIVDKQWCAAMQALVYIRCINGLVDITPLREQTQASQWRDFMDVHTYDAEGMEFVMKHQLRELLVRRGYKASMEAKEKGTEDLKTYNDYSKTNQLTYSPLIATEPETLVMLTDRSYENKNIIKQLGGANNTLAYKVVQHLEEKYNIKASVSYGSRLSGNIDVSFHFETKPDEVQGPERKNGQRFASDLTVIIPKEQFIKYADSALATLPASYNSFVEQVLPEVPNKRLLTPRQRFNMTKKGGNPEFNGKVAIKSPKPSIPSIIDDKQ